MDGQDPNLRPLHLGQQYPATFGPVQRYNIEIQEESIWEVYDTNGSFESVEFNNASSRANPLDKSVYAIRAYNKDNAEDKKRIATIQHTLDYLRHARTTQDENILFVIEAFDNDRTFYTVSESPILTLSQITDWAQTEKKAMDGQKLNIFTHMDVCCTMIQLSRGLIFLALKKLYYDDLNDTNIFLDYSGVIKIGGFDNMRPLPGTQKMKECKDIRNATNAEEATKQAKASCIESLQGLPNAFVNIIVNFEIPTIEKELRDVGRKVNASDWRFPVDDSSALGLSLMSLISDLRKVY
ncbi:hypothetical protein N7460_006896 [Penicillium canescens]|uniref:Protein kinase domain-containing protein n=1 Tax=Penicillium canescens TaxID=5083 RepID=A0AAD6N8H7_PENCN|nr:hypothetical protein N7460_006896 [Penicillium canescens]KAJ6064802.1 hypothetical protein N7444_000455 [Penicillium canescens]